MSTATVQGAVIRSGELEFRQLDGCRVATAVGPHLGARIVRLDVVRVPSGAVWRPQSSAHEENVVVVFAGSGSAASGAARRRVNRADTVYTPTGDLYELSADAGMDLTAYVWNTTLRPDRAPGTEPRRFSRLWN
jgi:glyoxylate utilization-related uncharacterized protein